MYFQTPPRLHVPADGFNNDGPRNAHSIGGSMLCDADDAFYITVAITASFLLEKSQGAEGYTNNHTDGSVICN